MKVKHALSHLSKLDPEEEVMMEWFEKQDIESHFDAKISNEEWSLAVHLFEKTSGDQSNFEIEYFLSEAKERLAAGSRLINLSPDIIVPNDEKDVQ